MKKSNVILQAAIAAALLSMGATGAAYGAASVVPVTTPAYALELFNGSTPTTGVQGPVFSIISGSGIAANSTFTVLVELTNGIFGNALTAVVPSASAVNTVHSTGASSAVAPTIAYGSTRAGATTAAAGVAAETATASNANVIAVQFTATSAVGIGGTLATFVSPTLNLKDRATAGSVTATVHVQAGTITPPTGSAITGTDLETSVATAIASSTQGLIVTTAPATGTAGKIDLAAATTPAHLFDGLGNAFNTTTMDLGNITVTNSTTAKKADGVTAYTVAMANNLSATFTGTTGVFTPLGTTGQLFLKSGACVTSAAGGAVGAGALGGLGSTVFTTAPLAAAATTLAYTAGAVPVSGTVYHICMGIPGTIAAVPGTITVAPTVGHTSVIVDSNEVGAATVLYPLAYNGQTKYVRNYIPAAVVGFTEIVRVSNTGAVAAPVTIVMKSESGATIGTPFVTPSLAAGATTRLTQAAIEAGVGATAATLLSTDRPRLTVTAPTNGLDVQTLMFSAGVYTSLSGTE